jgi:hypothetical protein
MKPGDKVHWTHTSVRGRSLSLSRREGEIVSVSLCGGIADVRRKSGRVEQIYVKALRLEGERGTLDEFVEAVRDANRKNEETPE